jgi:S1/P1 Nuclease
MLFLLISFALSSYAWWCNGHMTVAMVAQLDLISRYPEVFETCQGLLAPLNGKLTHDKANTFVETACWADDIKEFSFEEFNSVHFIDRPYNPQGLLYPSGSESNIIWAIQNLQQTLQQQTAITAPLETSLSLRFLIHFLGDLHQPLHATNMWSNVFPNGDLGGNLFPINFNADINELHALWDSCMGVFEDDLERPLDSAGWDSVTLWASWAMANYTREDLSADLLVTDLDKISIDSYLKAVAYAYPDIEYGGTPSQDYLESRWQVILKQIALGGYRLSDILVSVLSTNVAN